MTSDELAAILAELGRFGLRRQTLAFAVGYRSDNSIRQMLDGTSRVPPELATWLTALRDWHRSNPPPQLRGTNPGDVA